MGQAGAGRAARTLVHVRPGQAAHWARLRVQRTLLRSGPQLAARWLTRGGPDPVGAAGWPAGFQSADARMPDQWLTAAQLRDGKIQLLGVVTDLGEPPDWRQADAPLLWRFHLHYWDWAWGLAAEQDDLLARAVFARLWRSWQAATELGRGDAWLPYPAALRAWSWCGQHAALVAGSDLEPEFTAELARHAGFLRRHLEYDVGGNHLIKGIKAVAGLAVFFADERLLQRALARLARQLAVQILPDGGHYERAPAYHCQVLADLIDLAGLLRSAGRPVPGELARAIARMRRWLGVVLGPDGRVPLRGDGFPVHWELIAALRPVPPGDLPLLRLPDTGYARLAAHGWHVLAYVGEPGEPGLAAHAHADTLGCLAWLDGRPVLADTGTSAVAPNPTAAGRLSAVRVAGLLDVKETSSAPAGLSTSAVDSRSHSSEPGARCQPIAIACRPAPVNASSTRRPSADSDHLRRCTGWPGNHR